MRNTGLLVLAGLALAVSAPAFARDPEPQDKPDRPVTQKDVTAKDVVATPATDLNLKKDEIPPLLITAEERPYSLSGLGTCQQIGAAIVELDGVLGEDVDLPQTGGRRTSAGRVAQSVVGSLIPFRGLIREVSGANAHDRALQAAVLSGVARRSFLKGIGQGRGCRYPARSATLEVFNNQMAALNDGVTPPKANPADAEPAPQAQVVPQPQPMRESRADAGDTRFVSRPVVQRAY